MAGKPHTIPWAELRLPDSLCASAARATAHPPQRRRPRVLPHPGDAHTLGPAALGPAGAAGSAAASASTAATPAAGGAHADDGAALAPAALSGLSSTAAAWPLSSMLRSVEAVAVRTASLGWLHRSCCRTGTPPAAATAALSSRLSMARNSSPVATASVKASLRWRLCRHCTRAGIPPAATMAGRLSGQKAKLRSVPAKYSCTSSQALLLRC